jgi:RimJ/RimL family protein N-acetyltransferase
MEVFMLQLRPLKQKDIEEIQHFITSEEEFWLWNQGRFLAYPVSEESIKEYFNSLEGDSRVWSMCAWEDDELVGHVQLRLLKEECDCLKLGMIFLNPHKRKMGYGSKMLTLVLEYAKHCLAVDKVRIGVYEDNIPAKKCYERLGFHLADSKLFQIENIAGYNRKLEFVEKVL